MKVIYRIMLAAVVAIIMSACGNNESTYQYKTQYLPVQLVGSELWSILDVNSGEVVVKDAYDQAPSPVVAGMFYVRNSEGSYDLYDVNNPSQPVVFPEGFLSP